MLALTDRSTVFRAVAEIRPSCIIHAAALSQPDTCERDQNRALNINVEGTRTIAAAAQETGARVVYVSTDMVFDGTRGDYCETDNPVPANFYGRTKLEGERVVLENAPDSIIIRITLQYGYAYGAAGSFSDWLLKNIRAGRPSPLFTDQYRTPAYVFDTARGLELAALSTEKRSVYHLSGPERIDRYTFGQRLAAIFNLPEHLLVKTLMRATQSAAPRPRDVSLNGKRFYKQFNFKPRNICDGLKAMYDENIL
jgi:dTDP-4-dehydrorhamnose reductase